MFIEPNQSYTAGVGQLAAAGFVPGTQSYLKRRQAVWSQTSVGKQLASEGFVFSAEAPMTAKQQVAKFQSETGGGVSSERISRAARPISSIHIFSMRAVPNSEHFTSFDPSISRAKS